MPTFRSKRPIGRHNAETLAPVHYLDGSVLNRPFKLPDNIRKGARIFVIIAAIIGLLIVWRYVDVTINAPAREQEAMQKNLSVEVPYYLPVLSNFIFENDEEILNQMNSYGFTMYESVPLGTAANGGFEIVKLPEDVTMTEAGLMYVQGVDNLNPSDAVRLLNGSWTLTVSGSDASSLRVRYADFSSGTIDAALDAALVSQGLENSQVTDSGVDDSGNTFKTGITVVDRVQCTWRVSVIPLKEVYDIQSIPADTFFVGIRLE